VEVISISPLKTWDATTSKSPMTPLHHLRQQHVLCPWHSIPSTLSMPVALVYSSFSSSLVLSISARDVIESISVDTFLISFIFSSFLALVSANSLSQNALSVLRRSYPGSSPSPWQMVPHWLGLLHPYVMSTESSPIRGVSSSNCRFFDDFPNHCYCLHFFTSAFRFFFITLRL